MDIHIERFDHNNLANHGTGSHEKSEVNKIIDYPFDKYIVKVELSPANEFIGIVEVKINKDFLSYKQKITTQEFHDVDEFYKE